MTRTSARRTSSSAPPSPRRTPAAAYLFYDFDETALTLRGAAAEGEVDGEPGVVLLGSSRPTGPTRSLAFGTTWDERTTSSSPGSSSRSGSRRPRERGRRVGNAGHPGGLGRCPHASARTVQRSASSAPTPTRHSSSGRTPHTRSPTSRTRGSRPASNSTLMATRVRGLRSADAATASEPGAAPGAALLAHPIPTRSARAGRPDARLRPRHAGCRPDRGVRRARPLRRHGARRDTAGGTAAGGVAARRFAGRTVLVRLAADGRTPRSASRSWTDGWTLRGDGGGPSPHSQR